MVISGPGGGGGVSPLSCSYGCFPHVLAATGSYACACWVIPVWAFQAFGVPLPVGALTLWTAYLSMSRHVAGVPESVPTPVLLEKLNTTPIEDAWMRRVVLLELVNVPSYASSLCSSCPGDCFLHVTTRSPTWAGSVMKALRDILYRYPIDAHSLHPIDFATIEALLRFRASSMWRDIGVLPLFCQLCSLPSLVSAPCPSLPAGLVVSAFAYLPFAGVLSVLHGCACASH
jgi:hypothetical protein